MPTDSVFQSGRRVVNSPFSTGSEIVRSGSSAIPRPSSAARRITCVSFVRIRPFTSTSELSPSRSNFHRLPNRVLTRVGSFARSAGAVTGGRSARNAGLLDSGHIDSNIRKAIRLGADPAVAVKMATLVPAQYFGFKQRGAVAPGYRADLVVVPDLESFTVEQVYKNGTLVAEHGKTLKPAPLDIDRVRFSHVMDSFDLDEITLQDLELRESGEQERVICLNRGELLTEEKIIPFQRHPGKAPGVDPEHNIVKLAVFERHHHSGHVGIGFLGNFSLKCGAVASSIAHDSHNLIVAGDNDTDMMLAGNTVRKNKGGLAFVADGQVVAELALPVAGLMSTESAESVAAKMQALNDALKAHGVAEDIGIFMTLAFVSLPVIPKLRLNTYGIIDVAQQKVVPAVF